MGIKKARDNRNVLLSVWTISYCAITILLLCVSVDDLFYKPPLELMLNKYGQCFNKARNGYYPHHSSVLFVLCTSFLIHSIYWSYKLKGYKNFEFLKKELCATVFVVSFSLRCNQFGMMVLLLSNIFTLMEECMKIFFIFNNVRIKSYALTMLLKLAFAVVSVLWSAIHFYFLPMLLYMIINKKVNSSMVLADFVLLLVLVVGLCFHYVTCVIDSPTGRMIVKTLNRQSNGYTLECFLFGSVSNIVRPTPRRFSSKLSQCNNLSPEENYIETKRRNIATVYQTVRCYMALKRRLKRIREKKAADSSTSENIETQLLE